MLLFTLVRPSSCHQRPSSTSSLLNHISTPHHNPYRSPISPLLTHILTPHLHPHSSPQSFPLTRILTPHHHPTPHPHPHPPPHPSCSITLIPPHKAPRVVESMLLVALEPVVYKSQERMTHWMVRDLAAFCLAEYLK